MREPLIDSTIAARQRMTEPTKAFGSWPSNSVVRHHKEKAMLCWRTSRRIVACAVICALTFPSVTLAQSPGEQTTPRSGKKRGVLLIVGGAALAGLGAAMIATYNPGCTPGKFYSDGSGAGLYCQQPIAWLADDPHQKTYGGVIVGLGAVMAVVGVLGMRGHRTSERAAAPPASDWRPAWLDGTARMPFTLEDLRPGTPVPLFRANDAAVTRR